VGAVSYLLDTHALLWWLFKDRRMSRRASAVVRDPSNQILASSASAWEIATKYRLGRLDDAAPLIADFRGWMGEARFHELPIRSEHTTRAGAWDVAHRDPFDRILAAQSVVEGVRLVSRDPVFEDFGIDSLW
jgi:PIN domain nuclease of toxin-antitoxin system